jgi:thiol-disulfide isomerase/thioredoxin
MDRVLASTVIMAIAAVAIPASTPTVADIDGHVWTPLAAAKGETSLVIFVSADCPVSARYAPEIDRIASAYAPRGVHTFLVYADLTATIPSVRQNMASFHPGSRIPAIIDAGFALTTAADATITPEAFVYTPAGRAYHGRIDDLYISIGKSRPQAQRHDLRDALDAVLAGRPVATPATSAVGCYIERVKGRCP